MNSLHTLKKGNNIEKFNTLFRRKRPTKNSYIMKFLATGIKEGEWDWLWKSRTRKWWALTLFALLLPVILIVAIIALKGKS